MIRIGTKESGTKTFFSWTRTSVHNSPAFLILVVGSDAKDSRMKSSCKNFKKNKGYEWLVGSCGLLGHRHNHRVTWVFCYLVLRLMLRLRLKLRLSGSGSGPGSGSGSGTAYDRHEHSISRRIWCWHSYWGIPQINLHIECDHRCQSTSSTITE